MPKCNCGEEAKLVEVKKEGPNKGRKFYACAGPRDNQCDYFEWADKGQQTRRNFPPMPPKKEPNWDEIRERKEESMNFLNAKNNAALILSAAIEKGELNLPDAMTKFEEVAQFIYDINEKKESR